MQENQFIHKLTHYYRIYKPEYIDPRIRLEWINTHGWESEIYAYTLSFGPEDQRQSVTRVLRLLTGGGIETAGKEYHTLSTLHRAGYPVPKVYGLGGEAQGFERPFIIMARIEGGDLSEGFPNSPGDDLTPLQEFIRLFRQLHSLDWRPYFDHADQLDPPGEPYFHYDRELAFYARYLSKHEFSSLEPIMKWLEIQREKVPCERGSIIHRDFHADNILKDADGKCYVIDWTSAEVSDYRFDLAWTLTLSLAYGGEGRREMILAEYERQMGGSVPELAVFEVAAILRRMGLIMISLTAGTQALEIRPEAVEAMRQEKLPMTRLYARLCRLTGLSPLSEVTIWLDRLG